MSLTLLVRGQPPHRRQMEFPTEAMAITISPWEYGGVVAEARYDIAGTPVTSRVLGKTVKDALEALVFELERVAWRHSGEVP